MNDLKNKKLLLVISGGIAAYKSLELVRLLKKAGADVICILTKGGAQFVTELSVSSLSENKTYTDLWSLTDKTEMGHIQLTRSTDLVLIAPASANMIAKLAHGLANDLASTALLASDTPTMIAPAMNVKMWENPATQHNIKCLIERGFMQIGPGHGVMACNEEGAGRMAEPEEIFGSVLGYFNAVTPLNNKSVLVTSGPTYEPIDPVRFIGNRSSGKQGHAIAESLSKAGANVTLISGPVSLPDPPGVKTIHVNTAEEMHAAAMAHLPTDIAICTAAVCDWSPLAQNNRKIKKRNDTSPPVIKLKENPDILASISTKSHLRPKLVIGFAAETEKLIETARQKRINKGCDWIIANNVNKQASQETVFGSDYNHVFLLTENSVTEWNRTSKKEIAEKLTHCIQVYFEGSYNERTQIAAR